MNEQLLSLLRSRYKNGIIPTPELILDLGAIELAAKSMKEHVKNIGLNAKLYYSYKTNNTELVCKLMGAEGFGAEVASIDELELAIGDGFSPDMIVFDGPLKPSSELRRALQLPVTIHIDSISEALEIIKLKESGVEVAAKFGIRFTHKYGDSLSRFGLTSGDVEFLVNNGLLDKIDIRGVHVHTGSNLASVEAMKSCLIHNQIFIRSILSKKHSWLDLGGGFPANTKRPPNSATSSSIISDINEVVKELFPSDEFDVFLEPGRSLVEDHGYLITKIHHTKIRNDMILGFCDAGLNLISSIRSWVHDIGSFSLTSSCDEKMDILYGSNCFESDIIARDISYSKSEDTYVVIGGCGGYDIPSTNFWLRKPYTLSYLKDGLLVHSSKSSHKIRVH